MKRRQQAFFRKLFLLFYGLFMLLCSAVVRAQDFHLSQYDAAPLLLNPSMTGMFDGKYRGHLHYRTQWSSISTKPFTTTGFSFDMPVKKLGAGLQVMNLRAGTGNYNAFSTLLSFSYDLASKTNLHHLAVGVQAGIIQKSVKADKFIFGNQYDAANGGGFNTDISSGETFRGYNFIIPAVHAGILYYYAKVSARLNPFIGISFFNLTQPEEHFFDSKGSKLPMRYYLHGGLKINVTEKIQLFPKFIYMQQATSSEFTGSVLLYYHLKDANTYLLFGPTYRPGDAAIIEAGIKKAAYTIRVSYDINTSALRSVSYYRGGFEASLTYVFSKPKAKASANCPRL